MNFIFVRLKKIVTKKNYNEFIFYPILVSKALPLHASEKEILSGGLMKMQFKRYKKASF